MKRRIIDRMEKEIIVAMKDMNFEKAVAIDNHIKELNRGRKDGGKEML